MAFHSLDDAQAIQMLSCEPPLRSPGGLRMDLGRVWIERPSHKPSSREWELLDAGSLGECGRYAILREEVSYDVSVIRSSDDTETWIVGGSNRSLMDLHLGDRPAFIEFARASRSDEAMLEYVRTHGLPNLDRCKASELPSDLREESLRERAFVVRLSMLRAAASRVRFFVHAAVAESDSSAELASQHGETMATLISHYQSELASVTRAQAGDWLVQGTPADALAICSALTRLQASYYLSRATPVALPGEAFRIRVLVSGYLPSLYAQVVSHIESQKPLGVCETCNLPFFANRATRRFCSEQCGNLSRVRRYRASKAD